MIQKFLLLCLFGIVFLKSGGECGKMVGKDETCGLTSSVETKKLKVETIANFGQIPWHAGIFSQPDGSFMCSGTLISSRHVLTSAICLLSSRGDGTIEVRLGEWDIQSNTIDKFETIPHASITVKKTTLYPGIRNYSSPLNVGEEMPTIALLQLSAPVDFTANPHVAPICLPNKIKDKKSKSKLNSNDGCFVSGWGYQSPEPEVAKYSGDSYKGKIDDPTLTAKKYEYQVDSSPDFNVDNFLPLPSNSQDGPISIPIPLMSETKQTSSVQMKDQQLSEEDLEESKSKAGVIRSPHANEKPIPDNSVGDSPPQSRIAKNPDPIDEYFADMSEELPKEENSSEEDFPDQEAVESRIVPHNGTLFPSLAVVTPDEDRIAAEEAQMFRHKQKYTMGKKRSTGTPHRHRHGRVRREINGAPPNITVTPIKPTNPFLKWSDVVIQEVCADFPQNTLNDGPIGKSCIVPVGNTKSKSLCLADLGSPITCIRKGKSIDSDEVSTSGEKTKERAYLAGIVTWKRSCFQDEENSIPNQNVTMIQTTQKFLAFLHKNIKDI